MVELVQKGSHRKTKIRKQLAASIILLRKQHDWTQEDLARKCHWSGFSRISHYENLKRTPEISDLITIADVFDVTLDELVQRKQARDKTIIRLPYFSDLRGIQKYLRSPTKNTDMLIPVTDDNGHADFAVMMAEKDENPFFDRGDLLLVSTKQEARHLDYVLIKNNAGFIVRQLYQKGNKIYARNSAKHAKLVLMTAKTPVLGLIVSRIKSHHKIFLK